MIGLPFLDGELLLDWLAAFNMEFLLDGLVALNRELLLDWLTVFRQRLITWTVLACRFKQGVTIGLAYRF